MTWGEEYKKNIESNQIKAVCPKCKNEFMIYPEHLGRAHCETCDVKLVKG